jgi:hypothetical protein
MQPIEARSATTSGSFWPTVPLPFTQNTERNKTMTETTPSYEIFAGAKTNEPAEPTAADLLPILLTISEQQAAISNQLAELLETLNQPAENSLIDELAELLQPLFKDLAEIKAKIGS